MPSNSSHTTIAVQPETRDALFYRKRPGDSYEDVIRRLLAHTNRAGAESPNS
ncbi:hypothetical protein ACFQPA_21835 [Halomarina halobia]|uniref:Uncharacterized protein n=1 Tax=Halomarina halobia TaxID=3033386 RepID=A0ABD6AFC0_9EURY|nr:hypothetical protein [Halomarina sp. PSR21]